MRLKKGEQGKRVRGKGQSVSAIRLLHFPTGFPFPLFPLSPLPLLPFSLSFPIPLVLIKHMVNRIDRPIGKTRAHNVSAGGSQLLV
jgi:hypothetical protein